MPTTLELRQKRSTLVGQCHAVLDKAEAEKRALTNEDRELYDKTWAEVVALKAEIDTVEGDDRRRREVNAALGELARPLDTNIRPDRPGGPTPGDGASATTPYSFEIKRNWQRTPQKITLAHGSRPWQRHQPDYRKAFANYLHTGHASDILHYNSEPVASLQTDLATGGGYMVAPEEFVKELIMDVDSIRWIRQLARTFTTAAQTLGAVKRTTRMASFVWGGELTDAESVKDTALAYGKRSLTPHYMTGMLQASRDLLRSAILPIEEYIRYEIGRDSGELEENAFLTGSGAMQPLGLFTATNDGIGTAQDISTGNTTTAIGADNLRAVKYKLKYQYRADPSLRWLFHRDTINQISRLKDGEGRYLWRDGITAGDPDSILSIPLAESEFAPNTFTTGLYVGLLGAFRHYWIADSLDMDLLVLVEKYANTNQIGYIARRKVDGMPQVAEAFVRCKLA